MFDRGYTGHEHLPEFGLINMNGRVYDPIVSRFLSPDPYIQAPGFTQSFNRYGYVFNNPLKYIDPTGYKSTYYRDWDYSGSTPPPCHGGFGWGFYNSNIANSPGQFGSFSGSPGNPFSMGGGNWVNSFGSGGLDNSPGVWLPPVNVSGGRIVGGIPKWWGDHPARYPGGNRSYFPVFNTFFSDAASRLSRGMDGLIRNMERLKSESKALARGIGQKGPFGNYSSSLNKMNSISSGLRWVGRFGPLINAGRSIYLYDQNKIGEVRLGYDLTVSGISYFPFVGPAISFFNLLIDHTIGIENAHQFIIDEEIHRANMARSGFMPPPRRR